MKKVLILGVNGFIGHHLSKRILASTDWHVFGMDMADDKLLEFIAKTPNAQECADGLGQLALDMGSRDNVSAIVIEVTE